MMEIKNLSKAAARIRKALQKKERIILYGDADVDGVTSVLVLQETIQSLGGSVAKTYFPDREKDGYGITLSALKDLEPLAPALLISMDLGISNFKEIELARKKKFEVIVVDHHEVLDKLPKANIVVDPKQPSDSYAFKGLAACGVTFRLAEKLLGKTMSPLLRKSLVELTAFATIADMMPREGENVLLIEEGLTELQDSLRPAFKVFLGLDEISEFNGIESKATQMISVLNVRDMQDGLPASYRLLTCRQETDALALIRQLMEQNKVRKEQIQRAAEKVRTRVNDVPSASCIMEGDSSFGYLVLGSVASIISQEYRKPAFIYTTKETESLGSVRAPTGYDTVEAMKHCKKLFITYGGHAKASGFRIENKNLEKCKKCLIEYFSKNLPKLQ